MIIISLSQIKTAAFASSVAIFDSLTSIAREDKQVP